MPKRKLGKVEEEEGLLVLKSLPGGENIARKNHFRAHWENMVVKTRKIDCLRGRKRKRETFKHSNHYMEEKMCQVRTSLEAMG